MSISSIFSALYITCQSIERPVCALSGIQPSRAQIRATLTSTGKLFQWKHNNVTQAALFLPKPSSFDVSKSVTDSQSSRRIHSKDNCRKARMSHWLERRHTSPSTYPRSSTAGMGFKSRRSCVRATTILIAHTKSDRRINAWFTHRMHHWVQQSSAWRLLVSPTTTSRSSHPLLASKIAYGSHLRKP